MKRILFILSCFTAVLSACDKDNGKQQQSIEFGEIAPQLLRDEYLQLQAQSSSKLPVSYASWDEKIAVIEDDKVHFLQAGTVNITAYQSGNEMFYEAPEIVRQLIIRDWDLDKKIQSIDFNPPLEWKISRDGQMIKLNGQSSSGLPVSYTLGNTKYGRLLSTGTIYVYHAGESGVPRDNTYDVQLSIVASQSGNAEYNPADNVIKTIRVIGDVFH
ncbi:MAG: hypothetical protein LBH04_03725 [Tannerellaceae bacterium]|jgi:hypothetical protein|nr:hypothetical protein [Tannerellaceae bacterium]